MIKVASRIVVYCCFLLLIACGQGIAVFQQKDTFLACRVACEAKLAQCNKTCRNNCPQCRAYVKQSAKRRFYHYVGEQYAKGEMIALQLNSFRDPLQCRKTTCNCSADFQVCTQACGGIIFKNLQVVSACC